MNSNKFKKQDIFVSLQMLITYFEQITKRATIDNYVVIIPVEAKHLSVHKTSIMSHCRVHNTQTYAPITAQICTLNADNLMYHTKYTVTQFTD